MSIASRLATLALCCASVLATATGHAAGNYASREDVAQFISEIATRDGFDQAELERQFGEAQMLPSVIKYILPPATPRQRSWRAYRPRYIDNTRINAGVAFWRRNEKTVRAASERYGVPEEVIVAIIGVETIYGRNVGNFEVFSALTTLAFDYPPRAELFRHELEELLLLARDQGRDVRSYRGSFAGALGLPQFLPSSWRKYAVDFDGDGTVDLFNSDADAIGSVANFLSQHGWQRDAEVATRVSAIGVEVQPLLDSGIEPKLNTDDLALYGIQTEVTPPSSAEFALIDLVTPDEQTEYWLGYQNFYVITRYNRSSFYAMSVFQFSQLVKAAHLRAVARNGN